MMLMILLTTITISYAERRCWSLVCLGDDYQKGERPDYHVRVLVSPLLQEVFKVDDHHFTISFDMWLKLAWIDNRIKVESENSTNREVFPSSTGTDPDIKTIGLVDTDMLAHMWVPQVMIPHKTLLKSVHGPPFHDQVLNIVLKNQTVWVDYWSLIKLTITCPMTFNWFPFDVQKCHLNIQSGFPMEFMVLENQHKAEDFASFHFQNTLIDYDINIFPPPTDKTEIELGGDIDSLVEFYGVSSSKWRYSQTGFIFQLSRRWSRYIFIYYLPSGLCVLTSWASFLINPQVIPGRMSLLVTLFLSLTTLLVSTISSSPGVAVGITALTAWIIIQYVFIVAAIIAYAALLAYIRFIDGTESKKIISAKTMDKTFIFFFPLIYITICSLYLVICIQH